MSRPPSSLSTTSSVSAEKLFALVQCRMCLDLLKDPRILPCHHSFCSLCLQGLFNANSGRPDFLCPIDREVIRISPQHGLDTFAVDYRAKQLLELYKEMQEERRVYQQARSLLGSSFQDDIDLDSGVNTEFEGSIMKVDISLQRLNEAVKDIKHSAAMTQTAVNEYFDDVSAKLKSEQKKLLDEIAQRSQRQIDNIEYEKYRLIETKKSLHDRVVESFADDLFTPLGMPTDTISAMTDRTSTPTPEDEGVSSPTRTRSVSGNDTSECCVSLLHCHVGQQVIDFNPNKEMLTKLQGNMANMGRIVCDFELKVSVSRDLALLQEYPFGLQIANDKLDDEEAYGAFLQPKGLTKFRGFHLVIANTGRNELVILTESFDVKHIISGLGKFESVTDVATFGNNLYIIDNNASQVVMLSSDGSVVRSSGKLGSGSLEMKLPSGVATDSRGRVIVTDSLNHRIKIFSPDLKKCVTTITSDRKQFLNTKKMNFPTGVCVDRDDNIYVCDTNNKRVIVFTSEGKFMREISSPSMDDPRFVAVSDENHVLVTDRENGRLLLFNRQGRSVATCSGIVDTRGNRIKFLQPYGVVVDGTDKIAITDAELNSIFIL